MKLPLINAVATLFAAMLVLTGCNPSPTDAASPAVTLDIVNHNATTLQQLLASGELTAAELTAAYLARIAEIDAATVNAIVEINPDAQQIANSLDEHRWPTTLPPAMHSWSSDCAMPARSYSARRT